jgi:hypothetical protein
MTKKINLDVTLQVRVTKSTKLAFVKKANTYGEASTVHRELVEAFVDDRVTIKTNPNKPDMGKLYNEH